MTLTPRTRWPVVGVVLAAVVVVVAILVVAISSDGDDASTTSATSSTTAAPPSADVDSRGTATSKTSSTATPTSTEKSTAGGAASPEDVAAIRYGAAYVGSCSSVPSPADVPPNSLCSLSVSLAESEAALFVGPPYSEFIDALLVRLQGASWSLADAYAFPPLGEEDPDQPIWVANALEIKEGMRPSVSG